MTRAVTARYAVAIYSGDNLLLRINNNRLICKVIPVLHSIGTNSVMAGVSFQGDVSMWISVSARQRAPTALSHCRGTSTPTIHQQQAYTHREYKETIPTGPTLKTLLTVGLHFESNFEDVCY